MYFSIKSFYITLISIRACFFDAKISHPYWKFRRSIVCSPPVLELIHHRCISYQVLNLSWGQKTISSEVFNPFPHVPCIVIHVAVKKLAQYFIFIPCISHRMAFHHAGKFLPQWNFILWSSCKRALRHRHPSPQLLQLNRAYTTHSNTAKHQEFT